jgi:hypothetical protein
MAVQVQGEYGVNLAPTECLSAERRRQKSGAAS